MRIKNFVIALLTGTVLALAVVGIMRLNVPTEVQTALLIPSPAALPELTLIDQSGSPVDAGVFREHWNLVFFGFTHCPDVCPITLKILASAQQSMLESGAESIPRIVLVSVDPERDTADTLQNYLDHFGPDHLGIAGELEQIKVLTSALGIYFGKVETGDGEYTLDHSAAVLVINPDGEFSALFSAPHDADNFVHDLPIIMSQP